MERGCQDDGLRGWDQCGSERASGRASGREKGSGAVRAGVKWGAGGRTWGEWRSRGAGCIITTSARGGY